MHLKTIPFCFLRKRKKNKTERLCLKFFWTLSAYVQQEPQPPKSMSLILIPFFSNPRSGSTKWQTSMIGLSFDSVYMKKSYQDNRKFLLRISHVKLLVYWKKIWRWKVAYTCSFLRNQYYLYINCINQKKEFPTQTESILYKMNEYWF